MDRIWKASGYVLCQVSRSWKQAFRDVLCCHPNIDPLIISRNGYTPFTDKADKDAYYEERAPLTPSKSSSSNSVASSSRNVPAFDQRSLNSNRQEEIRANSPLSHGSSIQEIGSFQPTCAEKGATHDHPLLETHENSPVTKQPLCTNKEYGTCTQPAASPTIDESSKLIEDPGQTVVSPALDMEDNSVLVSVNVTSTEPSTDKLISKSPDLSIIDGDRIEPEGSSDISEEDVLKLVGLVEQCIEPVKPVYIQTYDRLITTIDACKTPQEILENSKLYNGEMTAETAVAIVHYIYAKTCVQYERNSDEYNQMCGMVIKDKEFRRLLSMLEFNAPSLGNFALLTAASDLLLLRLTLRRKTIPTLLANVDVENLNLEELGLLASCLHTPNIPLVNSEYFYNVSASVAMQELQNINDLYMLLNIMKCFGRYFTIDSKRECEGKVRELSQELSEQGPDGRSKAAHMFDAFYRMEYAPNRAILQNASEVIVNSNIPIQPQDISAVFRYCVKYGYGFQDMKLLDCLSAELQKGLNTNKASQLTTNVKWLTVFYYYDENFMQNFVECVKRDIDELDFVALSDVLDALAQVYFVPRAPDEFFDLMYSKMIEKLPTLMTSHVHNAKRKLLLTAFHFAVYGRYPEQLIQLALSESQLSMHLRHSGTRQFLVDMCRAVSVERPDLLPKYLPMHILQNHGRPKLYAFEKDVQGVLLSICDNNFFHLMLSPVCFFPFFLLQMRLDGTLLPIRQPGFIPPHRHQMVQNIALIPLPRSRFCCGSKHAIGKTRLVLRLLRAQGARVVTVPHYDWDNRSIEYKVQFLQDKIFNRKTDDIVE